jgi:hypothetical protein
VHIEATAGEEAYQLDSLLFDRYGRSRSARDSEDYWEEESVYYHFDAEYGRSSLESIRGTKEGEEQFAFGDSDSASDENSHGNADRTQEAEGDKSGQANVYEEAGYEQFGRTWRSYRLHRQGYRMKFG